MWRETKSKKIAYVAIMLSICTLLNLVSFNVGFFGKASFIYLGAIISGFMFGPWVGAFTAGMGDLLAAVLVPQGGPPNPLISLGCASMGLFAGLIYNYFPMRGWKVKVRVTCVTIFLTYTLCFGILAQMGYYMALSLSKPKSKYFGWTYKEIYLYLFIKRGSIQWFWVMINGIASLALLKRLEHLIPRSKIENYLDNKVAMRSAMNICQTTNENIVIYDI